MYAQRRLTVGNETTNWLIQIGTVMLYSNPDNVPGPGASTLYIGDGDYYSTSVWTWPSNSYYPLLARNLTLSQNFGETTFKMDSIGFGQFTKYTTVSTSTVSTGYQL